MIEAGGRYAPDPAAGEASNAVFDRAAAVCRHAFTLARRLGVKTCVGTETPLTIPDLVKARLADAGRDPKDPAAVKDVYRGIFSSIAAAYPIDYYWFWTWEGWTWDDAAPDAIRAVTSDLDVAVEAWREVKPPFSLATCGWVLGPPSNRTLFDQVLPKNVAMSTINREVGKAPVDPGFARISGRSLWAIPWMEDDPARSRPTPTCCSSSTRRRSRWRSSWSRCSRAAAPPSRCRGFPTASAIS